MTFIEATRQNIVPLPAGAQAFSSGQPVSSTLPRAGYGSRVFVHVNGTMTITPGTGSASLSSTGPFSLLSRVGILVNAATDILSLSGYGCMCLDKVLPDADGAPALDTANPGFGGKFRIGIAEEERIHRRFSQDQAWCLYLHPIENVRNEAHGGAHDHPQRLEVVHQTTTPAFWPITRKLRSATPELLIIGPELRLRTCNLFHAIFPMLVGLIL